MARITVEDCLKKIDSQYDLVLLAKERTSQLNAGEAALVPLDNDKNTVVSLREIGEGKVTIKTLEDSAINKLRKQQEVSSTIDEIEEEQEDSFDKIYKGEVSKSGTAVLPSKRIRRIPEKNVALSVNLESDNEEDKAKFEKTDQPVDKDNKLSDNKKEQ